MSQSMFIPTSVYRGDDSVEVRFDPEENLIMNSFESLRRYKVQPNVYLHQQFVNRLISLKDFCTDEGQKKLIDRVLSTIGSLWYIFRTNMGASKERSHYTFVLEQQILRLANLVEKNSVLNQHYLNAGKISPSDCVFVKAGHHKICQNHGTNENFSLYYSPDYTSYDSTIIPIKGLITPNAAWGNFADLADYENYVALIANGRVRQAEAYAAAVVGGAHPHSLRDPFPFGHCKLLLFKSEQWANIFKHGEDTLTKEDLQTHRGNLDNEKIVVFTLDAANNQAHISMHRVAPGGTSVLVDVKQLVAFLDKAFEDGVCDYEELEYIYYNITPAKRK